MDMQGRARQVTRREGWDVVEGWVEGGAEEMGDQGMADGEGWAAREEQQLQTRHRMQALSMAESR